MADYRAVARQKAKKYGLDPNLFVRQISAESGFNPRAGSPAGAQGIAQIMPGTAKSWGVNPMDPVAALDAAAKNMANYVRQYGNWRDALVAYNAGPGRVGKPLYRETRAYISKILGGTNPKSGTVTATSQKPVRSGDSGTPAPVEQAGVDKDAAIVDSLLARRGKFRGEGKLGPGLLQQAQQRIATGAYGLPAAPNTAQATSPRQPRAKAAVPSSAGGDAKGDLLELFWQGPNGLNAKNGRKVPQGFVSGHDRHVHVAMGNEQQVLRIAQLAKSLGLNVGEHPKFGGVGGGHVKGSNHYSRRAVDVTGSPAKLAAFARRVARMHGIG